MRHSKLSEDVIEFIISRDLDELAQLTRYKVAKNMGVNQNYLSEKFKETTDKTVCEFINFEKMKRAEQMLKSRRDLSVKTIAMKVGIVKCKQFRAKFEKVYGMKPGKYRQACM